MTDTSPTTHNKSFSVLPASVALITPIAAFAGIYLLFAGHNNPGGGFAAGLVFGAIVTLRSLAGVPNRLDATSLICAGVLIVVAVAAAPLFFGDALLDQKVVSITLPVLGKIKSGSALPFDIGVTAIVVGLVIALLSGLRTGDVTEGDSP